MSSLYADCTGQGSVLATHMAAEDLSAGHSLPVEIPSAGHQNKADVAAAIARQWSDAV